MEIFVLAILIVLFGLVFDYTNGFHDAANVVATVIATRVLAPTTAIVLACVLNMVGATQISGVAQTIANGIVQNTAVSSPAILAAILGAIFWNIFTWYVGMPSSSSYALIGGLVGATWMSLGVQGVLWSGLFYKVVLPMILSPVMGYLIAFCVMKCFFWLRMKKIIGPSQKLFAHLQIGSASIVALSHGLNDAQKSMGIITLGLFSAGILINTEIPFWVIALCALVIGLGTASGGVRIIRTVGFSITPLKPMQGFAAETSASLVILTASFLGMPVSSTHMIVGSVTGVGMAKNTKAVRWEVMKKLGLTWFLTLPCSALVAALFWKLMSLFI